LESESGFSPYPSLSVWQVSLNAVQKIDDPVGMLREEELASTMAAQQAVADEDE